jgi:integrase
VSLQKRTNGQRVTWRVRWVEEGRHRSRSFDYKADAERFEADNRRRLQLGAFGTGEPSRMTLGEWIEVWWSRGAPRWARSTRVHRGAILDKWVTPYLEGVRLCDMAPARVREYQAQIRAAGCTAKQTNAAVRVVSAILGAAVEDDLLPSNPVLKVKRYPTAKPRPRALDPDQMEAIRANLDSLRDRALWSLIAYAGLRTEEALALRWEDVREKTIVIDRAYTHGEERPTKTYSRRTVEILAPLRADLGAWRDAQGSVGGLVAPSEVGTHLNLSNWRSRAFKPAAVLAGIDANPYDGRHSYASLLIHSGRSPLAVAAALGHASAETTWKHYAHLFDEARLASSTDPEEAIWSARRAVSGDPELPQDCPKPRRAHLRLVS